MRSALATLAVAAVLVTAGCLAPVGPRTPTEPVPPRPSSDPGGSLDGPIQQPDAGTEPNASREPSVDELPNNPWRSDRVVVAINESVPTGWNASRMVRRALSYWEHNAHRYTEYSVNFVLRPEATDPDVEVRFVDVVRCHGEVGWLGCAPVLNGTAIPTGTQVVAVKTGYTANDTVRTLKHEFGHLLGLRHGDEPDALMAPTQDSRSPPSPDAINRSYPWRTTNMTVYLDVGEASARDVSRISEQVSRALRYYEDGAEGYASRNVTFAFTGDRETADVVIEFADDRWCGDGPGSCARPYGRDVDGDGRVEYYTRVEMTLSEVSVGAIDWHVGYWLGATVIGASSSDELPPPFRNRSTGDDGW